MKKLLFLSTGGTITMTPAASGISPSLTAADLVQSVPQLSTIADIVTLSPAKKPSASLTIKNIIDLAQQINEQFDSGIDGAVVIQGTDTIEETAFLLSLLTCDDKPIVVCGAMRGAAMPGADGPANLMAAAIVASSPSSCGRGVLVVLNDEVHSATFVQKSHSILPSAFTSPLCGPVGLVIEETVQYMSAACRPATSSLLKGRPIKQIAPVALVSAALGDDDRLLVALTDLGYCGVVIEAMGAGHVPDTFVPVLQALAERMPVILSTRVSTGPVLNKTYSFPGSEMDLIQRGLIPSGILSSLKAKLLLTLLITVGATRKEIESVFINFQPY